MSELILGETELKSRVFLAPMAGVTDLPFRKIVRKFGDFMMYSEMIASYAVIRDVKRTKKMMDVVNDEFTSIQLVGADPKIMSEAAKIAQDLGANFLDINMGCPVKKIVKSEAGSALMKNEKLAARIMLAVVQSVSIPVTLKMRLGWDAEHKNAATIACIAQNSGISMITVHGRTRSQLYSEYADWIAVSEVKRVVDIPVIVNGDIIDTGSAERALRESSADGVMIGRGALGSPWSLKCVHDYLSSGNQSCCVLSDQAKYDIATQHLKYMIEFYQPESVIKIARKVLMYYCKGNRDATKLRKNIVTLNTVEETYELLYRMFLD
ncbi:MAG: tRNA dihydrouridine synthase DusB [Holosporales bacterium]|jgi:tRNA-dihydrouridine synthase B|nr:tRNA dihydrouridine synthase DusB [Holosporales bacterium]